MRRVLAPIVVSLLLAAPASAQVGDEQYSDPLAQPEQTQTQAQKPSSSGQQPTLSTTPQGSSASGSSGTAGTSSGSGTTAAPATTATAAAPAASATQLPNTGVDARLLAAIGAALLLVGIGLRLRTADERF